MVCLFVWHVKRKTFDFIESKTKSCPKKIERCLGNNDLIYEFHSKPDNMPLAASFIVHYDVVPFLDASNDDDVIAREIEEKEIKHGEVESGLDEMTSTKLSSSSSAAVRIPNMYRILASWRLLLELNIGMPNQG